MKKNFKNEKIDIIQSLIYLSILIVTYLYGIIGVYMNRFDEAQGKLIRLQAFCFLFVPLIYVVLRKKFRIKIGWYIKTAIYLFIIGALVFGESMLLYYKTNWWDDLLHAGSGFGIAFIGITYIRAYLNKRNIHINYSFCIVMGICISFAAGFAWELLEYSCDSLAGTNMQKFMPELSTLFNGGNTFAPLNGTDLDIAEFFRNPEGYRYGLKDTMHDMIDCFFGTITCAFMCLFLQRRKADIFCDCFSYYDEEASIESIKAKTIA